jgi:uncharacterized protein YcfJ
MKARQIGAVLAAATAIVSMQAAAEIVLYGREGFEGRSLTARERMGDLRRADFNDRASSAIVYRDRWEVCEDVRFAGKCVVLRPGRYPNLEAMGINNSISSVRPVVRESRIDEGRYAPAPAYPVYDARPRRDERLFEADVVAVRAVYGRPEQRCWVERERVADRGNEVGGAIVGGLLGGVLGHQIGSGRGNDLATGVGAVAGAAIGSNVAREQGGGGVYTQDVRKCSTVPGSGRPEYYDVVYRFRGQEHRMQTQAPPGPTVTVNGRGEPRAN